MRIPKNQINLPVPEDGEIQPWKEDRVASVSDQVSQHEIMTSRVDETASAHSLRGVARGPTTTTLPTPPTSSEFQTIKGHGNTPIMKKEEAEEASANSDRFTASFSFDILRSSIEKRQKQLLWFLCLYIFVWLVSRMTSTFLMAFAPLCAIPGSSQTMLCALIRPPQTVNFVKLVSSQSSTFEQLISESAGGSQLSIEVLKAEMATQDLSLLVRYSDLKSKDNIADMLATIGTDAKKASRGLSKLHARVVGAVDEVMALNNYVMVTIEGADERAPSSLLQAVSPLKLGPTAEEIVADAFTLAMSESERAIGKLIVEAEISSQNLEQLDADIDALHDMITRENKYTSTREKLLVELWTNLVGHKKAVRDYGDRLALLNDLGEYRKQAAAHVKVALRALHAMSDDLEVLRERVAAPGLLESKVPLHVHMESIRSGMERLQEVRRTSRGRGMEETVRMVLNGAPEFV